MELFPFLLPLFLNGAINIVSGKEWKIIVHRTDTKMESPNEIDTDTPIMDGQSITFYEAIQQGDFDFSGDVISTTQDGSSTVEKTVGEDPRKPALDFCTELQDGSWEDVIGQILRRAWLPGGSCPVQPGVYTLTEPVGPMTIDLNDYLTCGHYSLDINLANAISSKYIIEFPDDPPTC